MVKKPSLLVLLTKGKGRLRSVLSFDVCGGISPYDEPFDRLEGQASMTRPAS